MSEGEIPERPSGTLTTEQGNPPEQVPLVSFMEKDLYAELSRTPAGEDPAFWPLPVLYDLNYHIVTRNEMPDAHARAIGESFAPLQESLPKITAAYEILAYPHCQQDGRKEGIEGHLYRERERLERDSFELNDAELRILSKLTVARKIPFNAEKRLYKYSEVIGLPDSSPTESLPKSQK